MAFRFLESWDAGGRRSSKLTVSGWAGVIDVGTVVVGVTMRLGGRGRIEAQLDKVLAVRLGGLLEELATSWFLGGLACIFVDF